MRVNSTSEVSTNYPDNPNRPQNAGIASAGEHNANNTFEEYLRSCVQENTSAVSNRTTESQIAGKFFGLQPMLKMQTRPEPTLEDIAH